MNAPGRPDGQVPGAQRASTSVNRPARRSRNPNAHRIVIVGGGAGGLQLATRLGDKLGKRGRVAVTLIDKTRSHVWKPKLHEIAAGSMDIGSHEVDFLAQSYWHHFAYRVGEMTGLDRDKREVIVSAFFDDEGERVTPPHRVPYDTLVLCVGSQSNDFGTPGVSEHALKLESMQDARRFNRRLVNACIRADSRGDDDGPRHLRVAIIGAGATGVELAAELHRTTREVIAYGLDHVDPQDIHINLLEAAPRVLPALPERLSASTEALLSRLGVTVRTGAKVAEVRADGVRLASGGGAAGDAWIPSDLVVWAAGVKAPEFLSALPGLESNRIHQLVVRPTLQTTADDNVFAIGDCAACPWPRANGGHGGWVPPRAQAAHQQASFMVDQIRARIEGRALGEYIYRDFGSLVSLGKFSTIGNMMGGLVGGSLFIEGLFARLMYESLYKMHQLALHGMGKVVLDTLARMIARHTGPHVKLH